MDLQLYFPVHGSVATIALYHFCVHSHVFLLICGPHHNLHPSTFFPVDGFIAPFSVYPLLQPFILYMDLWPQSQFFPFFSLFPCAFELCSLASIHRFLTSTATATLVSAFVLSRIYYCNSLLFASTHDVTSHLQWIQNYAA